MLSTQTLLTTRSLSSFLVLAFLSSTAAAQVNWTQRLPASSPSARILADMAHDQNRGCSVLFGGLISTTTPWTNLNDTWEWDGNNWTQKFPATSPSPRYGHALAYDPVRGCTVLFGGVVEMASGRIVLNDTWEWDGINWTAKSPGTRPSARGGHDMAYDRVRDRIVLFGGQDNGGRYSDTWEWNGNDWTQRFPATVPNLRVWPAVAYDIGRDRVVMFGGWWSSSYHDDTWEWDGNDWTRKFPATVPPRRYWHGMTYDPARGRVVMYGGRQSSTRLSDHWEWDGTNWTQEFPVTNPGFRSSHNLVYDIARRRTVLFGGSTGSLNSETWECHSVSPATFVPYGTGCPGSLGVPMLAAANCSLPWIGETFTIQLGNLPHGSFPFMVLGYSSTAWSGGSLPRNLSGLGLNGCWQLNSADATAMLNPSGGVPTWAGIVPANPVLVGGQVLFQGAALGAGGPNPLGAALSHGGRATIGMR